MQTDINELIRKLRQIIANHRDEENIENKIVTEETNESEKRKKEFLEKYGHL